MSERAATMAKILMEEWKQGSESAESFVKRRFLKDKVDDLRKAVEIMAELMEADEVADDWFKRGPGAAIA